MCKLNETREMKIFAQEAARRKLERDDTSISNPHADNLIKSPPASKKDSCKSSRANIASCWISDAMASYIFLSVATLFLFFSLYHNVFKSDPDYTASYVKAGDFKRAESFVNSFLCGDFPERDYFEPEKAEALKKSAPKLLSSFKGIPASSVVVSGKDDNKSLVLKATCLKGTDAALIYLTPYGKGFYVSGIEIEKTYVMNNVKKR